MTKLILASGSKIRAQLLAQAGFSFEQYKAQVDERKIEQNHIGVVNLAPFLSEYKARAVAQYYDGTTLVIGADQVLAFEDKPMHKAKNMKQAQEKLEKLAGKTHFLYSSVSFVSQNRLLAKKTVICELHMRNLRKSEIKNYLRLAGRGVLASVGCYQIEGLGINLFDYIKGDIYSIMGFPLMQTIKILREFGLNPIRTNLKIGDFLKG